MRKLIVTRHEALVQHIRETLQDAEELDVIPHATGADVMNRHVVGVLPLQLAALAASVTVVPLDIPAELRGAELTIEQVREFARPAERYVVERDD